MFIRLVELYFGAAIAAWLGISLGLVIVSTSHFVFVKFTGRRDPWVQFSQEQAMYRKRLYCSWMWPLAVWSSNGRRYLKEAWKGVQRK